jgi:hypothetical protein
MAVTSSTPAATSSAVPVASTNACCAFSTSRTPAGPNFSAAPICTKEIDSSARAATSGGRPETASSMPER